MKNIEVHSDVNIVLFLIFLILIRMKIHKNFKRYYFVKLATYSLIVFKTRKCVRANTKGVNEP